MRALPLIARHFRKHLLNPLVVHGAPEKCRPGNGLQHGSGQGKAVASAAEAVARNPAAGSSIQTLLVLGLAFIESLALFTLVIIFAK